MKTIRIGTRGSKLALTQANLVAKALKSVCSKVEIEIIKIATSGDWTPDQGEIRLSETKGGKALFAKEIEDALLRGDIDCGVHSMKDMPSALPEGLIIEHFLKREDPRDAFIARQDCKDVLSLPQGACVGTTSPRRQSFLLNKRPDLKIDAIRGNVPTRLEKLASGKYDAIILAVSGLKRLGLLDRITSIIEIEDMLPAMGQGAIGIEVQEGHSELRSILDQINNLETSICVRSEREVLKVLEGTCQSPIGVYAFFDGQAFFLRAAVGSWDGKQYFEEEFIGVADSPERAFMAGLEVGELLKEKVPHDILAAL